MPITSESMRLVEDFARAFEQRILVKPELLSRRAGRIIVNSSSEQHLSGTGTVEIDPPSVLLVDTVSVFCCSRPSCSNSVRMQMSLGHISQGSNAIS